MNLHHIYTGKYIPSISSEFAFKTLEVKLFKFTIGNICNY